MGKPVPNREDIIQGLAAPKPEAKARLVAS
jgi:hypothetical protein